MRFSYALLSRLVDLTGLTPETVRDRLTFSGFEVEGMMPLAQASRLVIGKVISERPHPDSDHLHLLEVDCGSTGILNIVCGAPNARKGIKVIVALPGCELPSIGKTIQKGTIRGQESYGMCCSLVELGVPSEMLDEKQVSGIEELPDDAPIGEEDVLGYLGLSDIVLDVNVLPNRPDCLSYIGLARELSALFGRKLNDLPKADLSNVAKRIRPNSQTQACPRFDLLSLRDVKAKEETPLLVKRFLQASGIRPLSPLVDLGNFVMLLTGQPLNLYDADGQEEDADLVRDDYRGTFTGFDGKSYEILPGDLVISDSRGIVCLAGIQAGKEAMVVSATSSVDIELACFYHKNIRHTSSRLGLSSFSSQLFGKGRNPYLIDEAVQITLALLPTFLDDWRLYSYASFDSTPHLDRSFAFSLEKLNHRLGTDYTRDEVDTVLSRYRIGKEGDRLLPPLDRVDLKEQCDIDEEVFRFYGSERVAPSLEGFPVTYGFLTPAQKRQRAVEDLLKGLGYLQCITYTLISENDDRFLRIFSTKPSYRVINPMTKDHEYVRSELLSSMLLCLHRNQARQLNDVSLFEISPVDTPEGSHLYLSLCQCGCRHVCDDYGPMPYSFLTMKGAIVSLFQALSIPEGRYRLSPSSKEGFNPMASADVFVGKDYVGTFGVLSPAVDRSEPVLGQLDLGYLLSLPPSKAKLESRSAAIPVKRDVSFRLPEGTKADFQSIKKTILRIKDSHIVDVRLFDLFRDEKDGEKYLGLTLYIGADRTLKDEEIAASVDKAVAALSSAFGLSLRGGK